MNSSNNERYSLREEMERELALFGNRLFEHRLTWRNLDEDETEEYFRVQREFVDKHIKAILKAVKERIPDYKGTKLKTMYLADDVEAGWNAYRQEMLRILEEK